jgi:hypothetical protein
VLQLQVQQVVSSASAT